MPVDQERGTGLVGADDSGLRVVADGEPDAHAVLLLSNALAPVAIFDPVVPLLAGSFLVIRVELLGHGGAAGPAGGYGIAAQASRVAAVLDKLGVCGATVVGHSSGCLLATALAEQRPDLVAALALIDMGPDLDAKLPEGPLFRLLMAPLTGRLLWRLRTEKAIRKAALSGSGNARRVDIPDAFVEHALRLTLRDFVGTMRAGREFLLERSLPDRLIPLALPLLVIFGADDGRWRSESAAGYRVVPGARIELLPGVGHTPMMEDPDTTGALLLEFAEAAARC
jgi:pimeloyl-ACP methyl ester carboxylesterase